MGNLYTKIFQLDPKEVEKFIIELTIKQLKFNTKEEEEQWWKDFRLEIKWLPTHNSFYVYVQPNLDYPSIEEKVNDIVNEQFPNYWGETYTFKGREITLGEYLWHQSNHYHYNFREIYSLMTGETEIWGVSTFPDEEDISLSYSGIYHKEYIEVIKTKSKKWFVRKWEKNEEIEEYIEKRLSAPEELLNYVKELDPKEVELR